MLCILGRILVVLSYVPGIRRKQRSWHSCDPCPLAEDPPHPLRQVCGDHVAQSNKLEGGGVRMQRMSQHHEGMLSTLSFVYKFALARGGLEERKASWSAGTRASEKEKNQDGRGEGREEIWEGERGGEKRPSHQPLVPRAPLHRTPRPSRAKSIQIY